jgi:hypothetical protein
MVFQMNLLVIASLIIAFSSPKDTIRIVVDSIGSKSRLSIIGDSIQIKLLEKMEKKIKNVVSKLDQISNENECDDFSSDTLDLRILTENTKGSKKRWVRSGPIYPYGEVRIRELMALMSDMNPELHPNKVYKIQYLKYCKTKRGDKQRLINQ